MWEKNVGQRVLIILAVLIVAAICIRNPKTTLRPGLDIAGGVSLIFEIDDRGQENNPNLAEDMKRLLQKRVDPKGVYDLTWRVHGRNRLEVQMPLPPANAQQLRSEYADALDDLNKATVSRAELEDAVQRPPAERAAALGELAGQSPQRIDLANKAAAVYDEYVAVLEAFRAGPAAAGETALAETQPTTAPARTAQDLELELREAEEALEDAYDEFLATNLDRDRFVQILDLPETSKSRIDSLEQLKKAYPELWPKIERVLATHAAWSKSRGFLDGPQDLQRLLRGAGVLEFRILAEPSPDNPTLYDRYRAALENRGPRPAPGDEFGWFRIDNAMNFFNLRTPAELREFDPERSSYVAKQIENDYYVLAKLGREHGLLAVEKDWQLRGARPDRDEHGRPSVQFQLDIVGGQRFEELTRNNIGRPLCILVDNVAYSAPNIQSKIGTHGQITGEFSPEKVNYLVQTMQAGSLPARLKETPISERTIGSSLGATNRDLALRGGLIGVAAVIAFLGIYYMVGGMIANTAMLLNLALTLAVMAFLQARFNLAGIAGLVLTIGMSVDANVLIFERMREEKERGSSLRMIISHGYDKAFSAIIDSNLTTILSAVIIYYLGSDEIKGFGLTLGWGIAISMFTALFVTRTIFTLLVKYNLLKEIKMLSLIPRPSIDWYGKRRFFVPLSIVLTVIGLGLLAWRGPQDFLDVEFLGGVNAEIEVKQTAGQPAVNDVVIGQRLTDVGLRIASDADKLAETQVAPVVGVPNAFVIKAAGLDADQLAAMLTEPLEEHQSLARGGVERRVEENALVVRLTNEASAEGLQSFVRGLPETIRSAGKNISVARVGSVREAGQEAGRFWSITTTEQNKRLVQHALEVALGNDLKRQPRIHYVLRSDAQDRPFPVQDRRLENVIRLDDFPADVTTEPLSNFRGGVALWFDQLNPPQSIDPKVAGSVPDRLKNMRLQPGNQDAPFREFKVVGVKPAGSDEQGVPLYSSVVVLVVDDKYPYADNPEAWYTGLAQPEQALATAALDAEQSLRKVSQFKPQIAERSSTQAALAILLSWLMIIGFLWVRFGQPAFGIAGIIALVHDVLIALAFVGVAGWIGATFVGRALLISDFKIDMTVIAAILTIIGYSINDTIVIFDRIRETRGRLGFVTPQVINDAINQCMSRTVLTGGATFLVLLAMYFFGGASTRAFNYCMVIGVFTGTYSSFAIAAPLLMMGSKSRVAPEPAAAVA